MMTYERRMEHKALSGERSRRGDREWGSVGKWKHGRGPLPFTPFFAQSHTWHRSTQSHRLITGLLTTEYWLSVLRSCHFDLCLVALALCLLVSWAAAAFQGRTQFVFVNNETTPNTISAFQVDPEGVLTPVPGSPFSTGGSGGRTRASDDFSNATIFVKNNRLFACNSVSNSVSVFTIAPNGSLTAVAGSPFVTGGRFPIALVTNPRGTLLFVSNHDTGTLSVFTIASDGALSLIPGSPYDLRPLRQPTSLAMNSAGNLLVVGGENAMRVYTVDGNGAITPVGELLETGLNTQAMVMTDNDRFVYAVGLNAEKGLAGWRLSSDGQMTSLGWSPLASPSPNGLLGLAVNPRGNLLVATAFGEANVYLYRSELGGNLTPATVVPTSSGELRAIGFDPTGTFALAADVLNHRIHAFRLNSLTRTLQEIPASPFDVGHSRARPSGIAFTGN